MHLADILRATSAEFGVSVTNILSKRRKREYVLPRHITIMLAREHTGRSLPDLGKLMGGRDHTTIMHALDTIPDKIARDASLSATVDRIRERLASPRETCPCCGAIRIQ